MKKLFILMLVVMVGLTLSAQEKQDKSEKQKSEKVTFVVNMYCENCKAKIEKNISWEKGVKDLVVDLDAKTVFIKFDPRKITKENLKKAIEKLGYTCEISEPPPKEAV